jgi:hypothetical protein
MKTLAILLLFAATPTGPSVGTQALPFEAVDQFGKPHTLKSLLGPKGAILVFYRSADW